MRERQRQYALARQPWRYSTGPRTPEGKARSAANGRWRQSEEMSIRQLRQETAAVVDLIAQMRSVRQMLAKASGTASAEPSGGMSA